MKRARKSQAIRKTSTPSVLPESELRKLEAVEIRLHRATDVLTAIEHIAKADATEVNLGALAIAARDLIDRVLDDLAPFGRGIGKAVLLSKGGVS